jgi:formylglycine-generating enzyme required for sulfatase activity
MSRPLSLRRRLALVLLCSLVAGTMLPGAALAQAGQGNKYALVVGVRKYDSGKFARLEYTENDAEELAPVLSDRGDFRSVRVLSTTRGQKRDSDAPTAANLRAEIRKLLAKKKGEDTVLVALSGHGIQAQVKGKEESFFCPSDAQLNDNDTLLSLGKLFADLDDCGAGVKVLLVDACRNDPRLGRNVDIDTLPRLPRGTAALFSCSSGERAFESPKLGGGHGVFFHHVIEGLRGAAKNSEGEVTVLDLSLYVTRSVSRQVPRLIGGGARQTPELKVNFRGESPVLIGSTEVTNSIGMKLVHIPAGTFTMGSTTREQDDVLPLSTGALRKILEPYIRAEGPRHEVEITRAFSMGVYPVTQAEYQQVMAGNPSHFCATGPGRDKVAAMSTSDFPVERVTWQNAVRFCERLSELPGERKAERVYRLPTEAEWEKACRAGTETVFHFGNAISSTQANFNGSFPFGGADMGPFLERTCKVGSYRPNAWGLHDMHGNVVQWCSDWYGREYYKASPRKDPQGPSRGDVVTAGYDGLENGARRVIRGGCWFNQARFCRASVRQVIGAPDVPSYKIGFRVVCVPGRAR